MSLCDLRHYVWMAAAAGSPDAINEVLNDSRYEGAIEEIQPFTQIVDKVGIIFITGTAFLIITVAIWRNVLAGAYAAFPKFWDQVHVAHEEVKDLGWIARIKGLPGQAENINMGSLKRMLMRICPDVKVLTDFEDDTVEPKTYFTKAIAQMIAVVMIGVFIYNGYYRDVTVQVANFGSELFNRAIMGTDPIEIFDRVLNTAGMPEFSTDNALDTKGKRQNEISKTIYSKIISKYTDVSTAKDKSLIASSIESSVAGWLTASASENSDGLATLGDYLNKDEWKMSVDCTLTTAPTQLGKCTVSSDGNMVSFATSWDTTTFNINSTKFTDESWYATAVIVLQRTNVKNKDVNFYNVKMQTTASWNNGAWVFKTTTDDQTAYLRSYGTASMTINGTTYKIKITTNGIESADGSQLPKTGTSGTVALSGVKYYCNNQENSVTSISVSCSSAGTPTFTDKDAVTSVQLGDQLTPADTSTKTQTNSSTTTAN